MFVSAETMTGKKGATVNKTMEVCCRIMERNMRMTIEAPRSVEPNRYLLVNVSASRIRKSRSS
jgi:hypothetical protein